MFPLRGFVFLVLSLATVTASNDGATSQTVPFLAIGSLPYFGGVAVNQIFSSTTLDSVERLATAALTSSGRQFQADPKGSLREEHFRSSFPPPEVIIAFVYEKMSSASFLRSFDAFSKSSNNNIVDRLYNYHGNSLLSLNLQIDNDARTRTVSDVLRTVFRASPSSHIIDFHLKANTELTCQTLMSRLQTNSAIFNNGVPDLVLVHCDDNRENVQCIDEVNRFALEQTQLKSIVLISADSSPKLKLRVVDDSDEQTGLTAPLSFINVDNVNHVFITKSLLSATNGSSSNTTYGVVVYANSSSVFAVLLVWFLIFLLFFGISNVMSIESPPRFASVPLQIGKEN